MNRSPYYKRVKVNRFSGSGFIPRFKLNISKPNLKGALNNDLVSFRSFSKTSQEGYVVSIISRFKESFVVEVISKKEDRISVFFDDPQLSGLREILGDFPSVELNHKIIVQLTSFPPDRLKGKLVKILGHSSKGEVEYLSLVEDLRLPKSFNRPEIQEEIELLKQKREGILSNAELYQNLEDSCFFTIDGVKAKDFDDAIFAEKKGKNLKLYVAIADVWGYLSHCPEIMNEAQRRGVSIYLLDRVIPMLPPILSEDLCSLREGEKRHTVCLSVEIDSSGRFLEETVNIFPATILSRKRFTYQEVNKYFESEKEIKSTVIPSEELEKTILAVYELVNLVQGRLSKEGNISLRIFQNKFEFKTNENEEIVALERDNLNNSISQKMVETCMIIANQLVAKFFSNEGLNSLYRVHKTPELERLRYFSSEVKELGCSIDILDRSDIKVQRLNEFIDRWKEHPHFQIIQYNLLQALPKAEYSVDNIGHFGINLKYYLHFTSPIRRLPDLLVHKALWVHFFNRKRFAELVKDKASIDWQNMSYVSNLSEQKSITAERRFISRKIYRYLISNFKGEAFKGVVTSRSSWGYNVRIENIYDGFVKTQFRRKLGEQVQLKKADYSWDEFVEL